MPNTQNNQNKYRNNRIFIQSSQIRDRWLEEEEEGLNGYD